MRGAAAACLLQQHKMNIRFNQRKCPWLIDLLYCLEWARSVDVLGSAESCNKPVELFRNQSSIMIYEWTVLQWPWDHNCNIYIYI
jgi:hypothetical protein